MLSWTVPCLDLLVSRSHSLASFSDLVAVQPFAGRAASSPGPDRQFASPTAAVPGPVCLRRPGCLQVYGFPGFPVCLFRSQLPLRPQLLAERATPPAGWCGDCADPAAEQSANFLKNANMRRAGTPLARSSGVGR